jgi:Cu+-exporting ATPase
MKDPVCGMEVKENNFESTYMGRKYIFCSNACKLKFDKNPKEYVKN